MSELVHPGLELNDMIIAESGNIEVFYRELQKICTKSQLPSEDDLDLFCQGKRFLPAKKYESIAKFFLTAEEWVKLERDYRAQI